MIITFCGHSKYIESKEDEEKILSLLTELIGDEPAELYLGGYGAFDAFAQRCGRKYQKTHPKTKLVLIVPYITSQYQKDLYDEINYPSLEDKPLKFAISYRNKWMVDQADFVIAYISHDWGGAYQTYKYANRQRKPSFNISS